MSCYVASSSSVSFPPLSRINPLLLCELGEVCLTKIRDFLSIQDACTFQTTSKTIQNLIWRSIWLYSPVPLNISFRQYGMDSISYWKHLCCKQANLSSISIDFARYEMEILVSLLQRSTVDKLTSLEFYFRDDQYDISGWHDDNRGDGYVAQQRYDCFPCATSSPLAKSIVHSVLCNVDASYEGLKGGWEDLNDPLAAIADCCSQSLEHLSISLGMFNGGGIGLEQQVLNGALLTRFQQLQTLKGEYGDYEDVLRAVSELPLLTRLSWVLLCAYFHRYYSDYSDDMPPRFVLRSLSLVSMYINTFKVDPICFKEVDCPRLESIFMYGSADYSVNLDGPVNTAPGFQLEQTSHKDNHLIMPHDLAMRNGSFPRYNLLRDSLTFDLTLPDLPLPLINRNR